jgi:hypothetical protein
MTFISYAFLMSVFGEYIRFCHMTLMSDFSFLRAEHSMKEHVRFFQMDSKVISFEIKRGMGVH